MDTVTIRLNEKEAKVFREYAKLNDIPLSTLFKQTLEEKMEMELDMAIITEYEENIPHETYTHEEVKETLGL